MKCMLDLAACCRRKTTPTETDGVQSDKPCAIARHHREGRSIERELRPPRRHHRLSDPGVLMQSGISAEHGKIIDLCVAREATEARDDRVISDLAVVADMSAIHDVVVVADTRATPTGRRTHVDRDLFSNLCPLTDLETGRFAVEGPVLWFGPEARIGKDPTIRTDSRPSEQGDMRSDFDTRPEFHIASYERKRTDHHISSQHRSVFDACGRMNVGQGLSPFR